MNESSLVQDLEDNLWELAEQEARGKLRHRYYCIDFSEEKIKKELREETCRVYQSLKSKIIKKLLWLSSDS